MYLAMRRKTKLTSKQVGLVHGFRSGLEDAIAAELKTKSVKYEYEKTKLNYTKPSKVHTYTPDFYLIDKDIYIETKVTLQLKTVKRCVLLKNNTQN